MSNWDRFLDAFFNARVMAKYLPDIAHGTLVTIELAALVIVSGLAAGLALLASVTAVNADLSTLILTDHRTRPHTGPVDT